MSSTDFCTLKHSKLHFKTKIEKNENQENLRKKKISAMYQCNGIKINAKF